MKDADTVIIIILGVLWTLIYCRKIYIGEIRPVLATWLIFSIATLLGMGTYLKADGEHSLASNLYATMDMTWTCSIFLILLLFGKNIRRRFTKFEAFCLAAIIATGIIWVISNSHFVCNLIIQTMITIGYLPLVIHLWRTDSNTESYSVWTLTLVTATVGLYAPIHQADVLATVYVTRAILSIVVVLLLMGRQTLKTWAGDIQ